MVASRRALKAHLDILHSTDEKPEAVHVETICVSTSFPCERYVDEVTLKEVIPEDFSKFYEPSVYANPRDINSFGRPKFTVRNDLPEWAMNDIRSVLFIYELKPEWHGQIPRIKERGWKLTFMPLDAPKGTIVDILSTSCLYMESELSRQTRRVLACDAVHRVRDLSIDSSPLTLPEWRAIIENYMLLVACEAQVTSEYTRAQLDLKRTCLASMPRIEALCTQKRLELMVLRGSPIHDTANAVHVSPHEMSRILRRTRKAVYARHGLPAVEECIGTAVAAGY